MAVVLILGGTMRADTKEVAAISGTVSSLFGEALEGATVELNAEGKKRTSTTGKDGKFSFVGMPAGTYTVTAKLQGFALQRQPAVVPAGGVVHLDFGLKIFRMGDVEPLRVSGTVRNAEGAALAGATVVAVAVTNTQIVCRTTTDDNGGFQLVVGDAGQYVIYAHHHRFQARSETLVLAPAVPRPQRQEFVLSPLKLGE